MGTNYYLQHKDPKTGRVQDLHICKTSGGWTPSLVGYNKDNNSYHLFDIRSWFDWKLFLRDQLQNKEGMIFDEYDEPWSYDKFIKHIEEWQTVDLINGKEKQNHAERALKGDFGTFWSNSDTLYEQEMLKKNYWVDPDGYSFHDGEFS